MLQSRTFSWAASVLLAVALSPVLPGCTDVGDTSSTPGGDGGGGESDATSGIDSTTGQDAAEDSTLVEDSATDTGAGEDAADATMSAESSTPDAGTIEDTGVTDTGSHEDAGVADTGTVDSAPEDTGAPDAGVIEAGQDAALADTGVADTGVADTGSGHDAGGGDLQSECNAYLSAHTAMLLNSSGTTCTGTEETLFAKDPDGTCLACAFTTGCLDDTNGDTGQECEDTGVGIGITSGTTAECISTLSCDLGLSPVNSPAPAAGLVVNAYCGDGTTTAMCETGTGPSGKCISPIAAGFPAGYSATQIVNSIAVRSDASGMANALSACLVTSTDPNCGTCLN